MKNHPPPPSEESHPETDPLGKTVDETGDSLSLPKLNTINNKKQNMVIFYKKWKKYNEILLTKNKIIIIYHEFLPTPRRGSHVTSDKAHTQSSRYT